ncbi:MAG: carbohydrate ABC transporter permease [Coprobacillus sp.]|nr:carbohydrate ABC transporter permease [Coprobacillus sp.]
MAQNAITRWWKGRRERTKETRYARKHDVLYKRKGLERAVFIIVLVIFIVFAITFLFPFAWMLMNSFKTTSEFADNFMSWPSQLTWENYKEAFTTRTSRSTGEFNIWQMLGMSVLIAGVGTIVTVFFSSCAAYVVAKYKFPGRNVIWAVVIFSLIVPIVGALPSQIQLMRAMGLTNTVIGCIFLYSGGFGSNFLLLYSFFKNLSWTYVEAAKIDGANDFVIFFRIIIPMAKGSIIAVSIIQLIGLWNDYLTPSIYLPQKPTIAVGLKTLSDQMLQKNSYPLLFATIIVAIIPIIILFIVFNRTIMENTSVGGLKG